MERQRDILAFLKTQGNATLGELAEHLAVSKQGALKHLDQLETVGLVEHRPAEHKGPGRPGSVYSLTDKAHEHFPHADRELAQELVSFMKKDELEKFFAARARRIEAAYKAQLNGKSFEARVRELAEMASAHGHMTQVEKGEGGAITIRHCNCPIQDVATSTGHPCEKELEMYARLLGAKVTRKTWMGSGEFDCTYEIRKG